MTVKELIERLTLISDQGCGDSDVMIFDPDSEQWETITCMTYKHGFPVYVYSDDID